MNDNQRILWRLDEHEPEFQTPTNFIVVPLIDLEIAPYNISLPALIAGATTITLSAHALTRSDRHAKEIPRIAQDLTQAIILANGFHNHTSAEDMLVNKYQQIKNHFSIPHLHTALHTALAQHGIARIRVLIDARCVSSQHAGGAIQLIKTLKHPHTEFVIWTTAQGQKLLLQRA